MSMSLPRRLRAFFRNCSDVRQRRSSRRMRVGQRSLFPGLISEQLETRALLATFTVANLNDSGAGSLRQAVADANAAAGADIIDATGVAGTITLTSGQLDVTGAVTINGPGADQLTVSGNDSSRVMLTGSNSESGDYTINDLTIANGDEDGSSGGGIRHADNAGRLFLNRVLFRDNHANGAGALGVTGTGGIHVMDAAFVGNSANFGGSAIQITAGSSNWIMNSTFSGNTSGSGQPAIEAQAGSGQSQITRLRNLTITNSTGVGAGIFAFTDGSVLLEIENSIFSDNSGNNLSSAQQTTGSATISSRGNNLSDDDSNGFVAGDLTNTDPLLGPLADNGGPTQTHALLVGSPAIDSGLNSDAIDSFANPFPNDQRQGPFNRIFDGNGDGIAIVDIGAFEYYGELRVDTNTDVADDDYGQDEFSLREAINIANAQPGPDTITFASSMIGSTIRLSGEHLELVGDVTITGPGAASDLIIDAQGNSRVFNITSSANEVTLEGLTIRNGMTVDAGAGILSAAGLLTGQHLAVESNHATDDGGGISASGEVVLTNSAVSDNTTDDDGGGLDGSGDFTLINSTIANNTAADNGGGIDVSGAVVLISTTVTGNSASDGGGGIDRANTLTIHNSIVAGNTGPFPDFEPPSSVLEVRSSLIGDATGTTLASGNNNQLNVDWKTVLENDGTNPILAFNGAKVQTVSLLSGSPAIDAGDNALAVDQSGSPLIFDQRGFKRILDGDDDGTATIDIGAVEAGQVAPLSLEVSTNTDIVDGDYTAGELSLREAINIANDRSGADTINFDPGLNGSTITLGGTELDLTDEVTINGPGADQLAIDGDGGSRVFHVGLGVTANLTGLSITGGDADGSVERSFNGSIGGGILNEGGSLTVRASRVFGNSARWGAGINNYAGSGGTATLLVDSSTIDANTATGNGGGIYDWGRGGTADATIVNSTLSGNSAGGGGGIYVWDAATLALTNATIVANTGDGIRLDAAIATLNNTMVIGNIQRDMFVFSNGASIAGASSNNLIGDPGGVTDLTHGTNGNILGDGAGNVIAASTVIDTTLADNGGSTPTHALVEGSPAVDAGDDGLAGTVNDQRGIPFTRKNGTVDIGAYEAQQLTLTVDNTSDVSDGNYGAGELTLREAVTLANPNPGHDIINFDPLLSGSTITLAGTELALQDEVTIAGPGADQLTIDGNGGSRVFRVGFGAIASINNVTITGGSAFGSGGGILNQGTLVLEDAVVTANSTTSFGGAIRIEGPTTVRRSELSDNSAFRGGAIGSFSGGASSLFENVTISGNTSSDNSAGTGAGIYIFNSDFTFVNSTIANNTATNGGDGAGIFIDPDNGFGASGTATLINTIVADNTTAGSGVDVAGDILRLDHSLIESNSGFTITTDNGGNVLGTDPGLGALQHIGGPSRTHGLSAGGPAVNAGNDAAAIDSQGTPLTTDQRLLPRFNGTVDMGAFEFRPPTLVLTILDTDISENGGSTTATVTRAGDTDTTIELTVTLDSSDTGEATVPATVTIPVGQSTSAAFSIDAVDDAIVDDTQTVTVTATATAHADGSDSVDVTDDDVATLTVTVVAASISENGGSTTATVSRNTDTTNELVVTLSSSDTGEATVPATVTIPAGQTTSVAFDIDAIDDAVVDGTQTVTVTATAAAHADGSDSVDVTDDDVAASGNVDGDDDFDASDSFLIHLLKLSGTNAQVDQSKGSSSLTASQIRSNLDQLGLAADVDGDGDFDASDSFLIHLVKLSGTNAQIDQSKGASALTAAQIRANVDSLGGASGGTNTRVAARNAGAVGATAWSPSGVEPGRSSLFDNSQDAAVSPIVAPAESTPNDAESDFVWGEFRSWIDAI